MLATTVHVAALLAASSARDARIGARGADLDAVAVLVSIVSASALESRSAAHDKASGANGHIDTREGVAEAKSLPAETPSPASENKKQDEPETDREPELPSPAPVQASSTASAGEAAPSAPVGGQTTVAISNILPTPASGAAAASVGDVHAYSVGVVEILAKSRPRADAGMASGTVWVWFEIAESGQPVNVRVSKSSGKPGIDRLVIDAIQATTFPPPPAHASLGQRTYTLPYVFR